MLMKIIKKKSWLCRHKRNIKRTLYGDIKERVYCGGKWRKKEKKTSGKRSKEKIFIAFRFKEKKNEKRKKKIKRLFKINRNENLMYANNLIK